MVDICQIKKPSFRASTEVKQSIRITIDKIITKLYNA